MDTQLEMMEKRIGVIARETNLIACRDVVGRMEMAVKMLLYEMTITPTIFYNIEAWSNMRETDKDRLEVIQGKILKKLLKLPKSTPYWGILIELGIWPVIWQIKYKKLMLLHNLLHSDDERVAKQVIIDQRDTMQSQCWYSEVRDTIEDLELRKNPEETIKPEWKKITKEAITKKVINEATGKKMNMKKLRFLGDFGMKNYIAEMDGNDVFEIMKIKLNMTLYIAGNVGVKQMCQLCLSDSETTEHVFHCKKIRNTDGLTVESIQKTDQDTLLKVLKLFNLYKLEKEAITESVASEDEDGGVCH